MTAFLHRRFELDPSGASRHRSRKINAIDSLNDAGHDPHDNADPFATVHEDDLVGSYLRRLRSSNAQMVVRMHIDGYNSAEIADRAGLTAANVRQVLYRSLTQLRDIAQQSPSHSVVVGK